MSAAPPRTIRVRRTLAVAGAKGGVGKTLVTSNLALYLATIGRKVVAVDADAGGATLHSFLGLAHPGGVARFVPPRPSFRAEVRSTEGPGPVLSIVLDGTDGGVPSADDLFANASIADEEVSDAPEFALSPSPVPGLTLLWGALDDAPAGARAPRSRRRLRAHLETLDTEYIAIDLGDGTAPSQLDFWLDAEMPLFLTVPEPPAMEGMWRFVRAAFARHLLRLADGDERAALRPLLRSPRHAPPARDLLRHSEVRGTRLATRVEQAVASFRFPFVVNQTRVRGDLELGDWLMSASERRLGLRLDYLGYVDFDDTVWTCVRARRPVLIESPGTKASRCLEKIARRLLALDAGTGSRRVTRNVPPDTLHDLLEVDRGATDEEVRRAYKRARALYAPDALPRQGLFDEAGLDALRARLDEAHDVLLDPARRRPYELSVFPPEPEPRAREAGPRASQADLPPAPEITPHTDFTGALLRAVRESQGVTLGEISTSTKIGRSYLEAMEADAFKDLPAVVYVRGFTAEVAKHLGLDPEQTSRTYVRRLERARDEQGRH